VYIDKVTPHASVRDTRGGDGPGTGQVEDLGGVPLEVRVKPDHWR